MTNKPKTVLIVEDSPAQALASKYLLENEGLNVLLAENGRVGISMAEEHLPDAIILDIEMPELNGFEVCRRLKTSDITKDIPVVMLTIRSEPAVICEGINMGAIDFIPKDIFSGPTLLETLRQLKIIKGEDFYFNGCL